MCLLSIENNEAHSFSLSSGGTPGLRSFDLLNYNYIDTGHYLSKPDWNMDMLTVHFLNVSKVKNSNPFARSKSQSHL